MQQCKPLHSPWRQDFPLIHRGGEGDKPLAYLDNGATTQKCQTVIDTVADFYREGNATVHRGVYGLSAQATLRYEQARATIAHAIGAGKPEEIVFVRGVTEAINLVAWSYLRPVCQPGDEIILTMMEHHANIVPWQRLAEEKQLTIHVVPVDEQGNLVMEVFYQLLSERTKMIAVTHVSNVLGTINPVQEIVSAGHQVGAKVLVDGAQAFGHFPISVTDIGADFYTFSSHKAFGPSGVGALYASQDLLEQMQPYQVGGNMIAQVTWQETTFASPPTRFEAGTPNIEGALGFAEACLYKQQHSGQDWAQHEDALLAEMQAVFSAFPKVRVFGEADNKVGIISFVYEGVHAHDVATILDAEGVCARAGHHCCMPLMHFLGVSATTRASLAIYNNGDDLAVLHRGLDKVEKLFYG